MEAAQAEPCGGYTQDAQLVGPTLVRSTGAPPATRSSRAKALQSTASTHPGEGMLAAWSKGAAGPRPLGKKQS